MKRSEFHSRRSLPPPLSLSLSLFSSILVSSFASCACTTFSRTTHSRLRAARVARLMQSYVTGRWFYSSGLVVALEVCQYEIFAPFVFATSDSLSTLEARHREKERERERGKRIARHASLSACVSFTPLNRSARVITRTANAYHRD